MNWLSKLSRATAGAAFLVTMGVATAPAQAALLDFTYKTIQGRSGGSFTLNTDVADTQPDSSTGLYPKAISDFTVGSSNYGSLDLTTREESYGGSPVTGFGIFYNNPDQPEASSFGTYFTGKSLTQNVSGSKKLTDDPSAYMSTFGGGVVGGTADEFGRGEVISQLTVKSHPGNNTPSVAAPSASSTNTASVAAPSASSTNTASVAAPSASSTNTASVATPSASSTNTASVAAPSASSTNTASVAAPSASSTNTASVAAPSVTASIDTASVAAPSATSTDTQPVPEPSATAGMLAFAALGTVSLLKRKRSQGKG